MEAAYPAGFATIPAKKQPFFALPADGRLEDFLPPSEIGSGVCQVVACAENHSPGYAFRLGSAGFPNLKLRVQRMDRADEETWIFMVDTHDGFSKDTRVPPADHPDAPQWLALQNANRLLKEQIESAWVKHGLATVNSLLREDLK